MSCPRVGSHTWAPRVGSPTWARNLPSYMGHEHFVVVHLGRNRLAKSIGLNLEHVDFVELFLRERGWSGVGRRHHPQGSIPSS